MRKNLLVSLMVFMALFLFTAIGSVANAATLVSGGLGSLGEIERITLDNPADVYSGGVMVVGGGEMIIPKNLLIDLPANRLTLQQIFDQAPAACKALGESGLAKADKCNGSGTGGIATLHAVRTNAGNVIIGDLFIQKAAELVVGVVTYINYDQGYYRVNGITGNSNTGAMVRLNDPTSRHTIQSGLGCAGGPNCSPDPRFTLDPDNYTNTFATGYPVCIPSTVSRNFTNPLGGPTVSQASANGTGDYLCPDTNRTAALTEPPVADSRRFAPVKVGDSVTAEGNYETVGGVRFLSAHTSTVQKALSTSNAAGQPDYLFLEEVDIEAPAFQNQRQVAMFIGFTTFAPTDVDIWSIHRDPANNAMHEFPLASVQGCDIAQGGPGNCSAQGIVNGPANTNIFKIIYRDDYQKGYDPKLSPCAHLLASPRFTGTGVCAGGGSLANDFAVLSPIPHEIIARTGRKIDSATNPAIGNLITIDINGRTATNGEYLFPLGLNLGGIGVAEMSEIDLNLTNTPTIFDGIPWNLDRRLSPSGCLNGGCEAGAVGDLAFALNPFPFSGLDPRTQASGLPTGSYSNPTFSLGTINIRDRIFSYVDAVSGKFASTILPCGTGPFPANCPADPGLITINPTPALNIFPPFAIEDQAVVNWSPTASVTIDVLSNDLPILGTIDPASLRIASNPASGTVQINANKTITYFPSNPFQVGSASFTYTVANNFGSVSVPGTVTVTILPASTNTAPVAAPDAGDVAAVGGGSQTVVIDVAVNDIDPNQGDSVVRSSVAIGTAPTKGTATANANGTISYTTTSLVPDIDTFTYTIRDSFGAISNAATVTVNILNIAANSAPVAVDDSATTAEDTAVTFSVTANDSDVNNNLAPGTVVITAQPLNGTAIAGANGNVTYTPFLNFNGSNSFTYTVKDTLGAESAPATVTVTVNAVNDPPVAVNDAATTPEDTPIIISVTANDSDVEGALAPNSVSIASQPANGVATLNGDNTVTYTPNLNFNGTDTFTYTVSDGTTPSSVATVTVTVNPVNDAPAAVNDVATTPAGIPITFSLLANDTDIDGTVSAIASVTQPANGTVTANAGGTVTYTSNPGFSGIDTFTYTVSDNNGLASAAPATVSVTVTSASSETVTVLRAQYRAATREWRINGVRANGTSNSVTLYVGRDLTGTVLGTAPVLADGTWSFRLNGAPANPAPDATSTVSVQALPGGGTRLAFPVSAR